MKHCKLFFKVGDISNLEIEKKDKKKAMKKQNLDMLSQSELDIFMVILFYFLSFFFFTQTPINEFLKRIFIFI